MLNKLHEKREKLCFMYLTKTSSYDEEVSAVLVETTATDIQEEARLQYS